MKNCREYIKELKKQRNKLVLNKEQIKVVSDVFNFALHYLEQNSEDNLFFTFDEEGYAYPLDINKYTEDITKLSEYIKSNLEVKDENTKES